MVTLWPSASRRTGCAAWSSSASAPTAPKKLVALAGGYRESKESWAALLRSLRERGLSGPVLAVGDGALGFWAALRDVFPTTKEQRCWVHYVEGRIMLRACQFSRRVGGLRAFGVYIITGFRGRRGGCPVADSGLAWR